MSKFACVKIPQAVADDIDKVIKEEKFGFNSRADLVKAAVRDYIPKLFNQNGAQAP